MTSMVKVDSFLAEGRLRQQLEACPDDVEALRQLAGICLVKRQRDEALTLAERLCALVPGDVDAQLLRGRVLEQCGRLAETMAAVEAAAQVDPNSFAVNLDMARTAQSLGDHARAAEAFHACATAHPADPQIMMGFAVSLLALHRFDDAVSIYRTLALNIWPQLGEVLVGIAAGLRCAMRNDDAMAVMRAAKLFLPDNPAIADHHGRVLVHVGRLDDALDEIDRAVQLGASNHELRVVRAAAHHVAGRLDMALAEIDQAVAQCPADEAAAMNRALLLMALGRWEEGWLGYDTRVARYISSDSKRLWAGDPIEGSLLVLGEQGLGDQVQSLRYLPLIRPLVSGRLVVQIAEPLIRLASASFDYVDEWVPLTAPRPDYDRHIPMMSLIQMFDRELPGTCPVPVPFLRSPPDITVCMPDSPGFKVGLCWAGSPGYPMDTIRSMPASEAARLIRRFPQVSFYRLQRGPVGSAIGQPAADLPLMDAIAGCADYAETAAVLDRLDLIITVDTSLAHVAAGLGKETWILIPHAACFRWGQTGETSPMYPSATLIRQPRSGEGWAETMDQVAHRLEERLAGCGKRLPSDAVS
jgi:tetratricopeptide (TPR) repeat protein